MKVQVRMSEGLRQLGHAGLMEALHKASPELARLLVDRVRGRTRRLTWALYDSIRGRGTPSGTTENRLVTVYASPGPQLDSWHRVYDVYQEGPPLGLPTYTNPPRQMFYGIETQDGEVITAWAEKAVGDRLAEFEAMPMTEVA